MRLYLHNFLGDRSALRRVVINNRFFALAATHHRWNFPPFSALLLIYL